MMKTAIMVIVCCVFVVGCGNEAQDNEQSVSSGAVRSSAGSSGKGSFNGSVGENTYAVEVKCSSLNKRFFNFQSDQTQANDSNGDGLIISGLQNTDDFILTIIDNGVTYTANRLSSFEKSATGAQGSGTLFEQKSLESFEAEFSVECQ